MPTLPTSYTPGVPRLPTVPTIPLPKGKTCLPIGLPPLPDPGLLEPFTINPPTPPIIPGIGLCCKIDLPIPPIPWPPIPPLVLNSGLIAQLNAALKTVRDYIALIPVGICPKIGTGEGVSFGDP